MLLTAGSMPGYSQTAIDLRVNGSGGSLPNRASQSRTDNLIGFPATDQCPLA
jgi:hypothetical protein